MPGWLTRTAVAVGYMTYLVGVRSVPKCWMLAVPGGKRVQESKGRAKGERCRGNSTMRRKRSRRTQFGRAEVTDYDCRFRIRDLEAGGVGGSWTGEG